MDLLDFSGLITSQTMDSRVITLLVCLAFIPQTIIGSLMRHGLLPGACPRSCTPKFTAREKGAHTHHGTMGGFYPGSTEKRSCQLQKNHSGGDGLLCPPEEGEGEV